MKCNNIRAVLWIKPSSGNMDSGIIAWSLEKARNENISTAKSLLYALLSS